MKAANPPAGGCRGNPAGGRPYGRRDSSQLSYEGCAERLPRTVPTPEIAAAGDNCPTLTLTPSPGEGGDSRPQRIQLQRTKGWRKPEGAIVVARPSKWGNPFSIEHCVDWFVNGYGRTWTGFPSKDEALRHVVALYRSAWEFRRIYFHDLDPSDLRGYDLACWCPLDQPCHADVLLELANR